MFDCVVGAVRVCYHLTCRILSVSFRIRISRPLTNAVFECDSSIKLPNVLCTAEWQWKCALFHVNTSKRTWPDWVRDCWPWAVESALRLAKGVDLRSVPGICFTLHLFLCVHERETISYSLLTSCISRMTMEATLETVCVCVCVCVCVYVSVCMCVCVANW